MVNFPTWIPDCGSHSPALLNFFLLMLVFVLQWFSLHWAILMMLLSHFPVTFHHIHNRMSHFIAFHMTTLMLTGMVYMIILEMFYGRISSNSVLLLLLGNFVNGFRSELMYTSHTESIRSSLTHINGFELLVLLP